MDLGFGGQNQGLGGNASQALEMIVGMQEQMLDDELKNLDNLDDEEKNAIRQKRVAAMKNRKEEEGTWSKNGHGHLTTLGETKDFFAAAKGSKRLVVNFSRPTSIHCDTVNGHLERLAHLHKETRFCTVNAEKVPYLCDKVLADPDGNIIIPTILLVVNGAVVYHIRGLVELGGENCTTDNIASYLQQFGMIEGEAATQEYEDQPKYASVDEYRAARIREGFYDAGLDADDDDYSDDEFTPDANDA
ncbi:thioredoxin-like protein [Pelagophyceae sp. CCMP2097]|nr:thioredoxin-like protein [Pelagophyceae sp. CCMP2097]